MGLRVRKNRAMPPPGRCPLGECMSFLRGAWAPNVLWYLSGGARRFGELRIDMPKISARVLSARLREFESKGVVTRRVVASSPPSVEYELTDLGQEIVPALRAMATIGEKLKQRADAECRTMPTRKPGRAGASLRV